MIMRSRFYWEIVVLNLTVNYGQDPSVSIIAFELVVRKLNQVRSLSDLPG